MEIWDLAIIYIPLLVFVFKQLPFQSLWLPHAFDSGHLRMKNKTGVGISFGAYEIIILSNDEIEEIKLLESVFF